MSVALAKVESWEDHVEAWHQLGRHVDGAAWGRAAIAASLKGRYGEDAVGRFAKEVGYTSRAVRYFIRTFEAFPENGNRFHNLTFTHHLHAAALTANTKEARAAAEQAERQGWSANELRRRLYGVGDVNVAEPADASCDAEGNACGPLTDRARAFHIAGLVESLTESMKLFEAMREYDVNPVVEKGTKKSLKELRNKIDDIVGWLTTLKQTIDKRIK